MLVPFLFVFYYMVATSLKSRIDITAADYQWFFTPTLENYRAVVVGTDFIEFTINSLAIGFGALGVALVVGLPAASAVARYNVPKFAKTAVHNFGLQEYMRHPEEAREVFDVGYWLEDGMLHVDDRPGLGVEIDEERAADFPYQRAYLPVARRRDGTVHSW